jgi:hypothetical protein
VAGPGLKIDGEPGEDRIDRFDFPEPPTAMKAVAALGQMDQ